ncbi:GNAT family N-acetyltransferase [Aureimonas sp. ME7]|uniref:GNAT family N-acetyltransferase n=1 Tax=Aureimonas sp. ME7 TaxID=2744252 RepID=UPI0015F53A79|nr:GNAT family N-acetyltransferase [Aureimonas sp. ME7]
MADVLLRPFRQSDADAIIDIWHRGASLPGVGPEALPSIAEFRDELIPALVSACRIVVAEGADMVLGFVALKPDERVLDQLFVRPDAVGTGIGRQLIDEAKRRMPDGFTLFTRPGNVRARRFYEASGLRALRTERHPRFGDEILFYGWTPDEL